MSDKKNPEEKLHDLYADLAEIKKPYIEANNAFIANPTPENKAKLDETAKAYEAAVKTHNEHKDGTEYKDHIAGQDNAPDGLKKVYVKDDFSNIYKPTLAKVVAPEQEETKEEQAPTPEPPTETIVEPTPEPPTETIVEPTPEPPTE